MKKRIVMLLSVVALMVMMLAMAVAPAFADVLFLEPPGPPAVSGKDDAAGVVHCNSPLLGGSGVFVTNTQGTVLFNCAST